MFTLKHVHLNGESLFYGYEPKYQPAGPGIGTVSYENEHGVRIHITGGTVYVMNDAGSTVTKWELGDSDKGI